MSRHLETKERTVYGIAYGPRSLAVLRTQRTEKFVRNTEYFNDFRLLNEVKKYTADAYGTKFKKVEDFFSL